MRLPGRGIALVVGYGHRREQLFRICLDEAPQRYLPLGGFLYLDGEP